MLTTILLAFSLPMCSLAAQPDGRNLLRDYTANMTTEVQRQYELANFLQCLHDHNVTSMIRVLNDVFPGVSVYVEDSHVNEKVWGNLTLLELINQCHDVTVSPMTLTVQTGTNGVYEDMEAGPPISDLTIEAAMGHIYNEYHDDSGNNSFYSGFHGHYLGEST